jgi:hypothetical protein
MIAFMGGEGAKGKFEPSTRMRGHLGAIIGQQCAYFEWSKLSRGLKTLIGCLCTLNLLAKSWKWWIFMKPNVDFLWRHWLVPLIVWVSKFYAIHVKTMEAYQLWWSGGMLKEMLMYYDNENQSLNNWELLQGGEPKFESHQCFVTFRRT